MQVINQQTKLQPEKHTQTCVNKDLGTEILTLGGSLLSLIIKFGMLYKLQN
jgi:hypothetical protein